MAQSHIITVIEHAIESAKREPDTSSKVASALGSAILKLTLNPERAFEEGGMERVREASIGHASNGVTWVDDVNSAEGRLYAWIGNRLAPVHHLSDAELDEVAQLVRQEFARRGRPD